MSDVLSPGVLAARPLAAPGVMVRSVSVKRERSLRRFAQRAALAGLFLGGCGRASDSPHTGVVVAEVSAGGAAAKAGLQRDDVLQTWTLEAAAKGTTRQGRFRDPFEVADVEAEEGPRGRVVIRGRRGDTATSWTLGPGEWKLMPEARLDAAGRAALRTILESLAKGRAEAAAEGETLARTLREQRRTSDACWVLLQVAEAAARAKLAAPAAHAFESARATAQGAGAAALEARAWEAEAALAAAANDMPKASRAYGEALRLREAGAAAAREETLLVALARARVAFAAMSQRDVDTAEQQWTLSLHTRERLAPESLPTASCLNGLGAVNRARGRLDAAETLWRRALAIREALAPNSSDLVRTLSNLGVVAQMRGNLTAAERFLRRGLEVLEATAPDGHDAALVLVNLAAVELTRGDMDAAEAYLRRAVRIQEKTTNRLLAASLNNLGDVYEARGRADEAAAYYRRALAIDEKIAPDSDAVAVDLYRLGRLARTARDFARARPLLQRSLDIRRRLAPQGLPTAHSLSVLGDLALDERQLARARSLHREALAIVQKLAPRSVWQAEAHYAVGRVLEAQGRPNEALAQWREAVSALEEQRGRLADSEQMKLAFGARYGHIFVRTIEQLAARGDDDDAFHMLERSRARSLLALLGERDLVFSTDDVPADLLERQRRADAAYDQAAARLANLEPGRDDAEIDRQRAELEGLRHRRAETADAVRRASPRLGSLQQAAPLTLGGARAVLDPGTLLLSYSVGETKTLLFALPAGDRAALRVVTIPVGRDAWRRRVELLRGLIDRGRDTPGIEPALTLQSRRLYDDLLGPVRGAITSAQRLLVLPDGPLHALPFAALVEPDAPAGHLVARLPVHVAASATVYGEMKKVNAAGARGASASLVAFGDPAYGASRPPLPATRLEVEVIAALYPGARIHLGADAVEGRAKSIGREARLVHFACHGVIDPRFPLDSGLALSKASGDADDNGLLQAWEVFEGMRLDADLVTLSACDTGLGRDMGGEGWVGLARAFQYAGARSVLASLWAVSDRSTAALMTSFYRGLRRGLSKDEALRAAQVEMLGRPETAHPYYWAAFQLSGLWN
jgi:tetratricopeptide (TPR) repeat protein